jgi:type II secretory pathway pseudopilin PulG
MATKIFIKVLRGNQGIALVTVILVIAILGILAAVAIETTGTDIINAGSNTSSEQTLNISNSAMNIVLAQLNTSQETNIGIGTPSPGVYYYTVGNNNTIQQSSAYVPLTVSNFSPAFCFTTNSGVFGFEDNNSICSNPGYIIYKSGFEYNGTYVGIPGYSLNYHFYNGQVNTITQKQIVGQPVGNPVQTGMTFSYGPVQVGYNQ